MSDRFAARAAAVAEVAAAHAAEVDRDAREPAEAVVALREHGLLGASVPAALGGEGASLRELSGIATALGAACASTGMVFAMHHGQAMTLWRHGGEGAGVRALIERVRDEGALLASSTTERGIGGDARRSSCALERPAPGRVRVVKDSPVVSYAGSADVILITARRDADAAESDQRLLACPIGEILLEPRSEWDTLGLRGTVSRGYLLEAETSESNLLADDYAAISSQTALPVSHVLWASVWLGIAVSAADTARSAVRAQLRGAAAAGPTPSPAALRLAELYAALQAFADAVRHAAERFDALADDRDALGGVSFALAMNAVKVSSADAVVDIVTRALRIVGIAGYRLDSEQSLGRQLRDAHGAAIQISNDRLLANNAALVAMARPEL
ncbi:MAG: acyl-CoA/acyl-ACP dehydrogenase [Actinomycetales bacterium]|nr:acyl-CoA/acyl-ACP dehydrogenase [Actinomycetales bacterium]